MGGPARSSFFLYVLLRQPSATMETMTSAFPSSTPSFNIAQFDNIIFYSGPASAKTREVTRIDPDEWPDIDMILAEDVQQEWAAVDGTQRLDPACGFGITGEGEPYSERSHSGLPSNARGFRHSACNRYKLSSAGGDLHRSASRGRQHAAV